MQHLGIVSSSNVSLHPSQNHRHLSTIDCWVIDLGWSGWSVTNNKKYAQNTQVTLGGGLKHQFMENMCSPNWIIQPQVFWSTTANKSLRNHHLDIRFVTQVAWFERHWSAGNSFERDAAAEYQGVTGRAPAGRKQCPIPTAPRPSQKTKHLQNRRTLLGGSSHLVSS